jgi:acetyl esterase/lipase
MINLFRVISLPAFVLLFTTSVGAQPQNGANTEWVKRKWLDVAYANQSLAQKLDVYLPNEGEKFPVIISIHGGAFMAGDKADGQLNPMLHGLKRGYAIVSINYRLSGEALFPKNINDVKAAIRWVKANAKQYGFDEDKIALWGGSAGGNLSALAGTSAGVSGLEDLSEGNASYSSKVQAVVDWFGPIDFLLMDAQLRETGNGKPNHSEKDSPESKVLGAKITEIRQVVKQANPETYISADDPSFFIQHGTKDPLVPTQQSINFAKKLRATLGEEKIKIHLLENAGHGGVQFDADENVNKVFEFLDRILKK